jgi:hypothetical protein
MEPSAFGNNLVIHYARHRDHATMHEIILHTNVMHRIAPAI